MARKVLLLDGNSLLYRGFFALPPLTTTRGEMTNAVYGLAVMLYKLLDEEKPDFIAAAFDLPAPTFRHEEFDGYKATRESAPDELFSQIPLAHEMLEAMQIPIFQVEGFEADDVLGALAKSAEAKGYEPLIVSGDLDVLQLVSDKTRALITRRGVSDAKRYDKKAVQERYGLSPVQLIDLKALRGDTTDNIPGVPGVGEKTAISLLQQFSSLEEVLDNLDKVKPARAAAALQAHMDQAKMSKRLGAIVTDIPLELNWEALRMSGPDVPRLRELFQRLEFRGLLKKLPAETGAAATLTSEEIAPPKIIQNTREAALAAKGMTGCSRITLTLIAEEGSPHSAKAVGFALTADDGKECIFVPAKKDLIGAFKPLLEEANIPKSGHNLKEAAVHLGRLGVELAGLDFDIEIASYLANPLRKNHDLWEVAFDMLATPMPEPLKLAEASTVAVAQRAAAMVTRIQALQPRLAESLSEQGLNRLFEEVEMPVVGLLAEMESAGVSIDTPYLEEFSRRLVTRIAKAEEEIFILAGEEFTVNSPKQLQHILYEKLELPRGRRTKTGYSTDAATLARLAGEYEIVARILEYRELTKLKSTYVDALPRLVNPRTKRIHPSFNQAVTVTGRLSCSDPNLQNIPIRTELGREIRRAFIAGKPKHVLLSADYSQIELRVLAHIAEDQALREIFAADRDLHTATACEIFGVDPEEATSEMRRLAKIVNFSIPYGTKPQGLAQRIETSAEEAREYMDRYFDRFAGVAKYMEEIVEHARESGHVETLLGRCRPLPEISASSPGRRELAERMAINTPIQGTAADIMKLAMLAVAEALKQADLATKMILQVHDELVFEGPESEMVQVANLAKEGMENAYRLSVPLKVELEYGSNWRDMKVFTLDP
ncbi:MAG: DNA polymerase I [Armatimonadetes bacterium]|nr:DNA polymerase I [Armatimonadota bacterium]NIM23274.1 DNA polymerase I [Armatimonadota bacterium]NIM67142.1 DNA polymerase I [Armatimonadota bacterium]NIM75668.1 DNA polymerase I [Armatimonadota bacterium]NIN05331.1 DNA polymerase I [Armatimonadota bacterium]